ncbi:MAG: hypothetical protein HC800_13545 [Phormidesmis sp. RL_2_1]|nr:hypothetical protein [Phormidesmis sp. RL_2_1]
MARPAESDCSSPISIVTIIAIVFSPRQKGGRAARSIHSFSPRQKSTMAIIRNGGQASKLHFALARILQLVLVDLK